MAFAVSGGLLIKAEVFRKVGLFDPGYAFYYEDVDFSQRARDEGFRIRFVPEARMFCREPRAVRRTGEFYYAWGESFSRYYRRHMRPMWPKLTIHFGYLILREALTGHAGHVPALCRGALYGLHNRMGDWRYHGEGSFESDGQFVGVGGG